MAKKRKPEKSGLEEVERTLYTSFCLAANSISHLYTQAQHQQQVAFQAGERRSVEKLYQWLQRENQGRSNISVAEILNYLQNELDGEEITTSAGSPFPQHLMVHQQQQHHQQQSHLNTQFPTGAVGYSGFTNTRRAVDAFSSPNRRCLPPFGAVHGSYGSVNNGGVNQHHEPGQEQRGPPSSDQGQQFNSSSDNCQPHAVSSTYGYNPTHGQQRDSQSSGGNDSNMDMHADGGSEDYYR